MNITMYGLKDLRCELKMLYDLKGVAQGYALLHEYSD